ncbi:hypothetical protein [Luteolibacter soli]|uniref:DUF3396 domain-containing protein n=1 Tax=Luteolibacter soli TaxID=3135280 RepID=A0ABU9AUY2_9BACT
MGLDTYFELTGADGERRPGLWRKNHHAILWLACFRVSDIVFKTADHRSHIGTVRCDIGTARTQFEHGLALLRQTFPETDFDIGEKPHPHGESRIPGVVAFRELLAGMPAGHAELPTDIMWTDFTGSHFDKFLTHALLGFSNPACKMFYDASDVKLGLSLRPEVTVPGVMTWGDVIRALTMGNVGIVLRQPGEDSRVHPPASLFTEYEYAIERWPLAGV